MHISNLLTAVAPFAALLSASTVDASSHHAVNHGHHAALARKQLAQRAVGAHPASKAAALAAAADQQAENLYRQAASMNGTSSPLSFKRAAKAPRKRKTCSADGSSKTPPQPSGAASSVVNVGASASISSPSPSMSSTKTSSAAPAATSSTSKFNSKWRLDLEAVSGLARAVPRGSLTLTALYLLPGRRSERRHFLRLVVVLGVGRPHPRYCQIPEPRERCSSLSALCRAKVLQDVD